MGRYLGKRLASTIPLLLVISFRSIYVYPYDSR